MVFYEVKVKYTRQTGEDNPGSVNETYLIESLSMADAERQLMDEISTMIFGGECEVLGCRKANYYDIFPNPNAEFWYKARVDLITVDDEKERHSKVAILVAASDIHEAGKVLKDKLSQLNCEIISMAKSPIVDVLHPVH